MSAEKKQRDENVNVSQSEIDTSGGVFIGRDVVGQVKVVNLPNPQRIRRVLTQYFTYEELRLLCFDLNIAPDIMGDQTKEMLALELIGYLQRRNRLEELIELLRLARPNIVWDEPKIEQQPTSDRSSTSKSIYEQITALNAQGQKDLISGSYSTAQDAFERSLELARASRDRKAEANALSLLARVFQATNDFDRAGKYLQQCLSIRRDLEDGQGEASTLRSLGQIRLQQGQLLVARRYFEQSLERTREIGDHEGEANALQELGTLARTTGDNVSALSYFTQAQKLWERLNEPLNVALARNESGVTLLNQGDLTGALWELKNALELAREAVSPQDVATILTNLALVMMRRSDWKGAQAVIEETVAIYRSLRNARGEYAALANLASVLVNLQEWDMALSLYQQSADLASRNDDVASATAALVNIGNIRTERDDLDAALVAYQQAFQLQQSRGDQDGAARTQDKISEIYRRRDNKQRPLTLIASEAQRFFQAAGFTLSTTGELTSFICTPATLSWQKSIKTPVYTTLKISQSIGADEVQAVHEVVKQTLPASHCAFILVDQPINDDAWLQIGTYRAKGLNIIPIPTSLLDDSKASGKANAEMLALTKHLEGFIAQSSDPYSKKTPVTDVLSFFGREKLAQELKEELVSGKPIGLFGLRKMGKSSLMRYMQRLMPCPTSWLDLQKGVELVSVYERILQAWQSDAQTRLQLNLGLGGVKVSAADPSGDFAKITQDAIGRVSDQLTDARFAIFLDEIELILPPANAVSDVLDRYLSLMRTLRGLVQEDGNVSLMVAGVDPAVTRLSRLGDAQNPFFQLLSEYYLPPLTKADCIQMIRNIGRQVELSYDDDVVEFVAWASGGHPFLARQLCSLALNERKMKPGEVTLAELQAAAEKFLFNPTYASIINEQGLWGAEVGNAKIWGEQLARSNQEVLLSLGRAKQPQPRSALVNEVNESANDQAHQLFGSAARETALITLDQLTVVDDVDAASSTTDPHYDISFGIFRDWIRRVRLGLTH
jgi:tetratricopeptide (TPR) repeat protein